MNTLVKKFEKMGARAKFTEVNDSIWNRFSGRRVQQGVRMNIQHDKKGTFFNVVATSAAEITVLDVQPKDRHLLVMAKITNEETNEVEKEKFLCGHDERDWFIARIPENRSVSNVLTAKEALKPNIVITAQELKKVGNKKKNRHRNKAFIRQGEWFFVPAPEIEPPEWMILRDEPMVRTNGGKPHTAEYLYRTGGTSVYISHEYPNGLSEENYRRLLLKQKISASSFQVRRLNMEVYVKGRITHPDHKTVLLNGWHRVMPNTEPTISANGRLIAMGFID
ncbi:MAG: hypothetical protein LBP87_08365 [Planctomycetaceae bacterium]|jgi:hypothetical protein|nr:hypothetical protein [Planctomycetaceae bacterium]